MRRQSFQNKRKFQFIQKMCVSLTYSTDLLWALTPSVNDTKLFYPKNARLLLEFLQCLPFWLHRWYNSPGSGHFSASVRGRRGWPPQGADDELRWARAGTRKSRLVPPRFRLRWLGPQYFIIYWQRKNIDLAQRRSCSLKEGDVAKFHFFIINIMAYTECRDIWCNPDYY